MIAKETSQIISARDLYSKVNWEYLLEVIEDPVKMQHYNSIQSNHISVVTKNIFKIEKIDPNWVPSKFAIEGFYVYGHKDCFTAKGGEGVAFMGPTKITGSFKHGIMNGLCTFIQMGNKMVVDEGEFLNGKLHGNGISKV